MIPPQRVALFYAPARHDPLWTLGASWLGRDPDTNAPVPQPEIPGIAEATADPRGYGLHATLKPPMRLRNGTGWNDVLRAVDGVAAGIAPFDLPPLAVTNLHGFLALRETTPSVPLQTLSDACVAGVDALRAPADDVELARRRRGGLAPAHEAMLVRWGYPYVFATWFFHMTLTRRLNEAEHAIFRPAAEAYVEPALTWTRRVEDICLFTQANSGSPFILADRIPLSG